VMLPGGPTRRTVALAALAPVAALAALALLDLATGGNGHFTRTVLHAGGWGELWDIVRRRYSLAYHNLVSALTPFLTAIALLAVVYAVRNRAQLYATVRGLPAWHAALVGSLVGSLAGALFNDSGPLLLLFGTVMLAFVTLYLRGDPRLGAARTAADGPGERVDGTLARPVDEPAPAPVAGRE
jgi:hypothetical protein